MVLYNFPFPLINKFGGNVQKLFAELWVPRKKGNSFGPIKHRENVVFFSVQKNKPYRGFFGGGFHRELQGSGLEKSSFDPQSAFSLFKIPL
jgi:hypothetical protein